MSHDNVEIVQRAWDAFDRGDLEDAFAVFAPDVEWDVSRDIWGPLVGGGRYQGLEGVRAWMKDLFEPWETLELVPGDVTDAGTDRVIGLLSARGRGRASGIDVEHHPAALVTLRERKVSRVEWFPTREEALDAAGLLE